MYVEEIEKKLMISIPKGNKESYFDPESYMGTRYPMLGLAVPLQREIFKQGYSFSSLPLADQLKIWDNVWKKAKVFEVLTQAAFFPEKFINKFKTQDLWPVLKTWVERVDNWGHSDMLSAMFAKMLVKDKNLLLPQLKKWNSSINPWDRRQSIVPLAMYHRRNQSIGFKESIGLVENLLLDEDYFVQKGVGWSLREMGVQYPEDTWKFLKKNAKKISAAAFSASVEKITNDKKEELKAVRKKK